MLSSIDYNLGSVVSPKTNIKYVFEANIGEGSLADVFKASPEFDPTHKVAIKRIDQGVFESFDQPTANALLEAQDIELKIMTELKHPNILHAEDYFRDGQFLYIVMEFAIDGTLTSRIKKWHSSKRLEPMHILETFKQVMVGLSYMNRRGYAHRDLKPDNVLCSGNRVMIADFNLSKEVGDAKKLLEASVSGTPMSAAPEMLRRDKYTQKVDIWSAGCILYEMFYGRNPFFKFFPRDEASLMKIQKENSGPNLFLDKSINPYVPEDAIYLMRKMIEVDQDQRYSWKEVFFSKFMEGVDLNKTLLAFLNKKEDMFEIEKSSLNSTASSEGGPEKKKWVAVSEPKSKEALECERQMHFKLKAISFLFSAAQAFLDAVAVPLFIEFYFKLLELSFYSFKKAEIALKELEKAVSEQKGTDFLEIPGFKEFCELHKKRPGSFEKGLNEHKAKIEEFLKNSDEIYRLNFDLEFNGVTFKSMKEMVNGFSEIPTINEFLKEIEDYFKGFIMQTDQIKAYEIGVLLYNVVNWEKKFTYDPKFDFDQFISELQSMQESQCKKYYKTIH